MSVVALFLLALQAPLSSKAQCTCPNGTAPLTQAYNQSLTTSMETSNFSFPQFDPTLGTLICTNVSALISSVVRIRMENDEIFPASYRIRYNRSSTISGAGLSPTLVHTFSKNYGPYDLAASDGVYFSGPDFIITGRDTILRNKLLTQTITGDITPFLGYGFVNYTYTLTGNSSISGGGNYLGGPLTSDFIDFTLTYSYCEDALLATGIRNFEVTRQPDNTAKINWQTLNEVAGNRYQIEISEDGRNYRAIASLPANIAANPAYTYEHSLEGLKEGNVYFRIRQLSSSSQARYSKIKSITVSANKSGMDVQPNPATDQLTLQFGQAVTGELQVELRNSQGMLVENRQVMVNGANQATIRLSRKPAAGIYIITSLNSRTGQRFSQKIAIR